MADTVADALSLLTRVSADTASMLKKLSKRVDNLESNSPHKKKKEKLVKEATPVIVQDYGRKAEKDLNRILGERDKETQKALEKEKNKNSNLLGLLGLAGAAALALKFLFDGEGFTGLVQGFQKAFKTVTKFASKVKGVVGDIGEKIGTFTDDIGARAKGLVDDVMTKVGTWADDAKAGLKNMADNVGAKVGGWYDEAAAGLKNTFDTVGQKLSSFGDDLAKGFGSIVGKAKSLVGITDDAAAAAGDVAKGAADAKGAAPKKQSWLSKAISKAKAVGGKVASGAKAVGGKVVSGAKAVGGAVVDTTKTVGKFAKDKVLKKLLDYIKSIKVGKILGAIAKSPLLAPIIESIFAYKDVNNSISDFNEGKINKKELDAVVGKRTFTALGGLLGGAGGAALLAAIVGGLSFGLGAPLGAIVGGILGDVGGRFIADKLADAMGDKKSKVGEFVLNTPLFSNKLGGAGVTEIQDGIITKNGQVIKPDKNDTLYAMKEGGPLMDVMNKTPQMLDSLINVEVNSSELLKQNNLLLTQILEKINSGNIISNNSTTVVSSNSNSIRQFRESFA